MLMIKIVKRFTHANFEDVRAHVIVLTDSIKENREPLGGPRCVMYRDRPEDELLGLTVEAFRD